MSGDQLFDDLALQQAPAQVIGEARLRVPQRDQIELRAVDIEQPWSGRTIRPGSSGAMWKGSCPG